MQIHQLRPIYKRRKSRRVGRGGKRGTYSGRGMKGQKSRAGRKLEPIIRGLIKRYPKLRGYRFKPKNQGTAFEIVTVSLKTIERKFSPGEKVTPRILLEKGIIRNIKGRVPRVKILGRSKGAKNLVLEGFLFSKQSKENIAKDKSKIDKKTKSTK